MSIYKPTLVFIICLLGQTMHGILAQDATPMPNERVYVHSNSTLLFPGDYLYYKCYVQRTDNKKLSALSKVVYVELINEEKESMFKHKLFLTNGLAFGDFFLDQSLSSGNYKLIAYTQWMKNLGTPFFFQQDISIINPYTNYQTRILKSGPGEDFATTDVDGKKKQQSESLRLSMAQAGARIAVATPSFAY